MLAPLFFILNYSLLKAVRNIHTCLNTTYNNTWGVAIAAYFVHRTADDIALGRPPKHSTPKPLVVEHVHLFRRSSWQAVQVATLGDITGCFSESHSRYHPH